MAQDPKCQTKPRSGWHRGKGRSSNIHYIVPICSPPRFLFIRIPEEIFGEECFVNQWELKKTVVGYFNRLDRQQYHEGMFKLLSRWDK